MEQVQIATTPESHDEVVEKAAFTTETVDAGPMNPEIKILVLSDSFLPHGGGSREYYNNIYQSLARSQNSRVLILTKKVPGWQDFDRAVCTRTFKIKRLFKPLKSWKYTELPKAIGPFLQTLWSVLTKRPDVIHAGDLYPPGLIALAVNKLFGIPYIIYCHGEEKTQTDRYRYQPRVRNLIYRQASRIIANSEFARQELLQIGIPKENIHKITPGVDSVRFRPQPPNQGLIQRFGLQDKTVILTVARLVPRKGHKAALQAFSALASEFPDAHYLIAGTGPEEARIRKQVEELGLENRVTLAGFIPGEQLPDLYNLCDIMLLANRQEENGDIEGFGIVFLEANAAGKPVIGGRSGGAIEAVEEGVTGYLVDPDDPSEIASALRHLLADSDLRRAFGEAGRKRSSEEYRWGARAEFLSRVNEDLIHGPKLDQVNHSAGKQNSLKAHGPAPGKGTHD